MSKLPSAAALKLYMSTLGKVRSEAKAAAVRLNGRKGGRPRKAKPGDGQLPS